MSDDIKALLAEAREAHDKIHRWAFGEDSELSDRHDVLLAVERIRAALEAAQVPATDDEREARKAAYDEAWGYRHDTRSAGEKNHYEFWFNRGWDAAAGFRRSSRVPVSRDELADVIQATLDDLSDVRQVRPAGGRERALAAALDGEYDIYPKADRNPADPGGDKAMIVHPACVIDCRHRCPACRMGLVTHLRCDPLCLVRSADSEEAER